MKIVVHDTAAAHLRLLRLPVAERLAALREILDPLHRFIAPAMGGHADLVAIHEQGVGFPLDGDDTRLAAAVEQMRQARVWERIEARLAAARDRLVAAAEEADLRVPETVHVVLTLGDPDDHHLVVRSSGYFGLGGFPGAIHLVMWPTPAALAKIEHAAAHELHHNVRYANVVWNPATVTVGEQVVAEGLAEAFVRELAGPEATAPFTTALAGAPLDDAYAKITAGIDVAGMQNLAPYVFGDDTAALMNPDATPLGIPDLAGYPVGLRIADAHLAATGRTAAQSVALPAREVLGSAGVPTSAA
ncbi:hypothetical protein GCM10010329_50720 [Streptomyces spiroverticillatus]|uniref:DUF2268 domain-containing protein n=1 Tax=Streptomyces finlayi TaxID=67296 RepID=A0A919CC68_9ACTN|nr:DUF2268 domain-containing putative Zn-dependent protease [Streptomyces finlayi]GHA21118.1 hypothetical protein GCM10010329_50720 [Streptomyces spiroverticillatus]GHD03616.1 hypothetical protein GCM10010334_51670 [Streptomyces finlayi]